MAGEVFLGKVEAGCHWGQEGGTPGFSLKASNIFGAQGFRDVFMTCGVKCFERGLAPKFSHVSLCYFKDREHSIRIPRDHSKGWMSYCVLILTLHFTGTMCSKLISRSVVFIVYSLYIHDIHKAHMMFRNAEIKQLTKQSLLS